MDNLKELLTGAPDRLRYVQRFSTVRVLHRESVAEHSYYVALIALAINRRPRVGPQSSYAVDEGELLRRALVHDIEEALTGDAPRPFKHGNGETFAKQCHYAGQASAREVLYSVDRGQQREHPGAPNELLDSWLHAKDRITTVGCIIELADFLAVLGYLLQEKRCGNVGVYDHCKSMVAYRSRFQVDVFNGFRDVLQSADTLLKELYDEQK